MATKEQIVAVLSFIGAMTVALSATIALYWQFVEIEKLRAKLKTK